MIYLLILVSIIIFTTGCNNQKNQENQKIAYISANIDSNYEKTFKDLHLGILFDFNLKLPKADKSWVRIWVEGYSNGNPVEPFPLTQMSYGLSPNKIDEGQMGFGMINPNSDETQMFFYSINTSLSPITIDNSFFINSGMTTYDYAIGSKTIGLDSGEELLLAVYRQEKESMYTYDYQDPDSIKKMIDEDSTLLLLKIKVEEKN
jgi:hypothetical protein